MNDIYNSQKGNTEKAMSNYSTILDYLNSEKSLEGDEKDKRDALVFAANLNLAACHLRHGNNAKVIEFSTEALLIYPNSAKANYRRAQVSLVSYIICYIHLAGTVPLTDTVTQFALEML